MKMACVIMIIIIIVAIGVMLDVAVVSSEIPDWVKIWWIMR